MAVDGQTLAVVIPAYRAAETIGPLVDQIPAYVDLIIVVDDASPDRLTEVITGLDDPRIVLLRHERNRGVGAATVTGFREALRRGSKLIAKLDADGQMDPGYLDRLARVCTVHGCDYVKGNRFSHLAALRLMPRRRLLGSIILTFLTKIASGYWNLFDPQNGYLLITRSMLRQLDLDRLDHGYSFENSMLINLNIMRARIGELSLPARYDNEPSSLRILPVMLTFPLLLLRGCCYRIFQKYIFRSLSPFILLLGFGLVAIGFGLVWGMVIWYRSMSTGVPALTGSVTLGLLSILLGWSSTLQAIVLDVRDSGPCLLFDPEHDSLQPSTKKGPEIAAGN